MITLRDKADDSAIGRISEGQLQVLIDQLEEEDLEDRDYAITPMLLRAFEAENGDPELIALLRGALGDRESMEIIWIQSE